MTYLRGNGWGDCTFVSMEEMPGVTLSMVASCNVFLLVEITLRHTRVVLKKYVAIGCIPVGRSYAVRHAYHSVIL